MYLDPIRNKMLAEINNKLLLLVSELAKEAAWPNHNDISRQLYTKCYLVASEALASLKEIEG